MADKARKTGIGIIGDVPWGTHFCHFYRAKEDLISILVPYFKTGLENNEFCLWATAEPLGAEEAHKAMEKAMPGFARYVERGQIEIMPHDQGYLQDGFFDSERVIRAWVDKLDKVLAAGYSGMRASGNMSWLERKDWDSFAGYEAAINRIIGQYKMLSLCAYCLENISAADIFEVAGSHTFAVVGRNGDLELVEGALYRKKAEEALRESEERYSTLVENATDGVTIIQDKMIKFANRRMAEMSGYTVEELAGMSSFDLVPPDFAPVLAERFALRAQGADVSEVFHTRLLCKDRTIKEMESSTKLIQYEGGTAVLAIVRDITERKRAGENLKASEERFRALIENASDSIAILDNKGTILYESPSAEKVFGHEPRQLMGVSFPDLVHPDDVQRVASVFASAMEYPGKIVDCQLRVKHKDGSCREVEGTAQNLLHDPKVGGILVNYRDVTDRKQAEEALKRKEEYFRSIIENSSDVITVLDASGTVQYQSPNYRSVWGRDPAGEVGRDLFKDVHPDDMPAVSDEFKRLLEKPGSCVHLQVRAQHEDGSWRVLDVEGRNLLDHPSVRGIVVNFHDITERKKAEENLKTSEERFRALIENSTDAITLVDSALTISYVSPSHEHITGYRPEQRLGRSTLEVIHPDDCEIVSQLLAGILQVPGQVNLPPIRALHADGSWRWIEAVARNLLVEPSVQAMVINFRDITERKKAEEALRASQERYRLLVENAHEMVVVVQDGKAVFTNPKCAELFGYTEEEMASRSFIEFIHPDNQGTVMEYYSKRLKGEHVPSTYSLRIIDKGGNAKWTEANTVLFTWNGRPAILGLITDVTERKKAEEELRASEERNRLLIHNASEGIMVIQDEKVVFGNPKYIEIAGLPEEEIMSMPFSELVHPDDRQMVTERYLKRLKGEEIPPTYAARVIDKAGNMKWVEANSVSFTWKGRPAILALVTDITERKEVEEALRESEGKLKALFEILPLGVSVLDAERNVCHMNPALERIVGISREGLQRGDYRDRRYLRSDGTNMPPEEFASVRAMKEQRAVHNIETGVVTEDGKVVWTSVSAAPVSLSDWRVVVVTTNITERKQAEDALKKSHQLLNDTGEMAKVGGWELDLLTKEVSLTEEVCRIHGVEPGYKPKLEEALDFYAPESRSAVEAVVKNAAETGEPYDLESLFIPRGSKDKIWVRSLGKAVYSGGEIVKLVGTFQDIDKYKRAEESLRESELKFRAVFDNANDGFISVDLESQRFFNANRRMIEMLGYESEEEIEKLKVSDIHPEKDLPYILGEFEKHARGEASLTEDLPVKRMDGSVFYASVSSSPLAVGEKRCLACIFRDITDRKRAEEALRESETRFRALFDAMPVVVVIATLEGKVLSVNNAIKGLSGYTPEEFMAMNMSDLYVDPSERKRMLDLLQEEGRVSDFEVMFRKKDGLTAHVLLNVDNFELAGQKLIMTTVRDITGLKQAEIKQRRTYEQLILASRLASLGRLASGVAHEINNPLAVVMGCAQMLMEKDTPEDVKKDLRLINDSALHMAAVVQRLLTFGRQSKPGKEYVDINALVSRVLGLRAREMSTHNIEVTTRLDPDLPWTMADVGQMQQVFLNIILNAEQAMTKANRDGHLLVKTGRTGDRITITFRDDGVGIPKEYLPRLFDPFFSTKDVGEGMGLGLSISYGIIREHNGRIYAKGQPGKGATFVVELPILAKPDQPESPEKPAEEAKEKVIGRILVVDDEPAICQLLRDLLTRDGHSVETVGDASVALEMVKRERFSLILLDIRMKGMNGIDLYRQMGKIAESLQRRVIFITGDTLARDTRDFLNKTEAPHICKPFDIQQLRKMINQVLWSGKK